MMTELSLDVELPTRVMAGFPVWGSVTVTNLTDHITYCSVPSCSPLHVSPAIRMVFRSPAHGERVIEEGGDSLEDMPDGSPLTPGSVRRTTADFSHVIGGLSPGIWELEASLPGLGVTAPWVPFEVVPAESEDGSIVSRFASRNDFEEPGWPLSLMAGPESIEPEELEELTDAGRDALRFWLFLHRATWGPVPLAGQDLSALDDLDYVLDAEAALVRHEAYCAQGVASAPGLASAILERWPGAAERVDANQRGEGLLQTLRSDFGAEG